MNTQTALKLGCIADDFTGATDLANNLVRAGMRVLQTIGVTASASSADYSEYDAIVVALKSRTIAADEAVAQSLAALRFLKSLGAQQIYFKYCSTFDSTATGNIGPVTDALMTALQTTFTIATPAFPDNGRTVFKGYLFVGDALLSESGMQHHPLTPMTDANLQRVLQQQTPRKVGLIDFKVVAQGAAAIDSRVQQLKQGAVEVAIVDALSNEDLIRLGPALKGWPLVTGGSGVAIGLPANWAITPTSKASLLSPAVGLKAIVAGSCSLATQAQVAHFKKQGLPALQIDQSIIEQPETVMKHLLQQMQVHFASPNNFQPLLIYSTADAQAVKAVQQQFGKTHDVGAMVEQALAQIVQRLVKLGVKQLVVAGGETSGACVQALAIDRMQIGPQIDPGVPWCYAQSRYGPLHLALKSGNFGSDDFFTKALNQLAPLLTLGK